MWTSMCRSLCLFCHPELDSGS